MIKEAAAIDLEVGILGQCRDLSDPKAARLDLRKLRQRPELAVRAAAALGKIVRRYENSEAHGLRNREVDMLIPATSDAAWLAKEVALQRGLWALRPQQDPDTGELTINDADLTLCGRPQRIVVVEGLHNDKNLANILSLPGVAEQAVAVAALVHLDDPVTARRGKLPIDAAIWRPELASVPAGSHLESVT